MMKKIILFFIFSITIFLYSAEKDIPCVYIIQDNPSKYCLSVYKKQGSMLKLIRNISYDDFQERYSYIQTDNYLYYVNYDEHLIRLSFLTAEIEDTKIKTGLGFSISKDDEFVCVSEKSPILNNSSETLIPAIYNLKNNKRVFIKNFSPDFLLNDIGISLDIQYNEKENGFDIEYNWDTPVPKFKGFIALNGFSYIQRK